MSKKILYVIVSAIICCVVLIIVYAIKSTDNEMGNSLQQKYPIVTDSQYVFETPEFGFEERIKYAPNIAYIKIVEKLPAYIVAINDKDNNISNNMVFHQYKASVIEDIGETNFKIDSDNTITICFADVFSSSYPALSVGMEIICSIEPAAGEHTGKYLFYDKTFYYVDSGMALAAYESDDSIAKFCCKKSKLIDQIKNIRKKAVTNQTDR